MREQNQHHRLLQALLLGCSLLFSTLPSWAVTNLDRIAAIVNDDVITNNELKDEMARIALQIQSRGQQLPPHATLRKQVMERLILTRLQLQKAKESGISISESTIANTINNIAQQNNITTQQLRETLEKDGVSFQAFRDDLRQQITLRHLQQRDVINRIFVTEQELQREIKLSGKGSDSRQEVQIQHILLGIKEGASEEIIATTRTDAEQLIDQLKAGGDFTNLAIQHSDGRRALEGGDLGWYNPSQVPTLFVDALSNMKKGDISSPIRSASGLHIIKLVDEKGINRLVITQSKARHILISTNEVVSDHDARTRLEQLRERIIGGDDFGALAQSHSDDTGSAISGGDLGWVSPGAMVPIFERQMDELALQEVSQPFRTQFGWHIVQILDRRDYDSTEEVLKNNALVAVRRKKADEATELWLRRLRDEAYIDLRLE